MKKSVLLGASTLATAGVVGGGVLLSGATNSSGTGDKGLEQSEEQGAKGPENSLPQRLDQPTSPPPRPTIVFHMNPEPPPTIDPPAVEDLSEEEEDEPEQPTVTPLTVDYAQEPEESNDQDFPEDKIADYTITDPALVLVESCENSLEATKLKSLIDFLYWENASLEDHLVSLPKAKQYLDNLIAGVKNALSRTSWSSKPYNCETLNSYYKEWLGIWDEKIKSAEGESEAWENMRNKYIDDILKKYFWQAFKQEYENYQAKLPDIQKSLSQA